MLAKIFVNWTCTQKLSALDRNPRTPTHLTSLNPLSFVSTLMSCKCKKQHTFSEHLNVPCLLDGGPFWQMDETICGHFYIDAQSQATKLARSHSITILPLLY